MKKNKIIAGVVTAALIVAAVGGIGTAVKVTTSNKTVTVIPVSDINYGYWYDSSTSTQGYITSDAAQNVYVSSPASVKTVYVKEGDTVKKGDVLLLYDQTESSLALQRDQLDHDQLQLNISIIEQNLSTLSKIVPVPDPSEEVVPDEPIPDDGYIDDGDYEYPDDIFPDDVDPEPDVEPEPTVEPEPEPEPEPQEPIKSLEQAVNFSEEKDVGFIADGTKEKPFVFDCDEDTTFTFGFFISIGKFMDEHEMEHCFVVFRDKSDSEEEGDESADESSTESGESDSSEPDAQEEEKTGKEWLIDMSKFVRSSDDDPDDPEPEPTEEPEPTKEPEPTGEPEPTKEPSPTEAPIPTEGPSPTETPSPTEAPSPTDVPSPTEAPAPTPEQDPDSTAPDPDSGSSSAESWTSSAESDIKQMVTGEIPVRAIVLAAGGMEYMSGTVTDDQASAFDFSSMGLIPGTAVYTKTELQDEINSQRQQLTELRLSLRESELKLRAGMKAMDEGKVTAQMNGVVTKVGDLENFNQDGSAFLTVSSDGGYFVHGGLSEHLIDKVSEGESVSVMSWDTGASFEGRITEISPYPDTSGMFADGSGNTSYYPFTAEIDTNSNNVRDYEWVQVSLSAEGGQGGSMDSLYVIKAFVLDEDGGKCVYVKGENGTLTKRNVQVGSITGDTYEIVGGLSEDDWIAFPYGKAVKEGAKIREGTISDLYQ